jgi:hypothetical protein
VLSNNLQCTDLLGLLFTDVGTTQHGGLDCGEDLELCANGGDPLTYLEHREVDLSSSSEKPDRDMKIKTENSVIYFK